MTAYKDFPNPSPSLLNFHTKYTKFSFMSYSTIIISIFLYVMIQNPIQNTLVLQNDWSMNKQRTE